MSVFRLRYERTDSNSVRMVVLEMDLNEIVRIVGSHNVHSTCLYRESSRDFPQFL